MTKPFTGTLDTFLAAVIATPDAPIAYADLFTLTLLQTGIVLRYNNTDQDIVYNDGTGDQTWSAQGPLIQGLKMKQSIGFTVDRQQVTIAAKPSDIVNGASVLASIAAGAWTGAAITRTRVFMTALGQTPVGGTILFQGRLSTVDLVGRTSAKVTVASNLVILDMDMPKNIFSPTCLHVLYDAGCTLDAADFETTSTAEAGSTSGVILWTGAASTHIQGKLIFTSGANADIQGTVKAADPGVSLTMVYPFPMPIASGDAFNVFQGCAHTQSNCVLQFDNLPNFRAFPFVPPPQMAF